MSWWRSAVEEGEVSPTFFAAWEIPGGAQQQQQGGANDFLLLGYFSDTRYILKEYVLYINFEQNTLRRRILSRECVA